MPWLALNKTPVHSITCAHLRVHILPHLVQTCYLRSIVLVLSNLLSGVGKFLTCAEGLHS